MILLLLSLLSWGAPSPRVLVFSRTVGGYRHASIAAGKAMFLELGRRHHIDVDTTEDAAVFTERRLQDYRTIVFLSTRGNVFDDTAQKAAFVNFIHRGGGFLGVHAATTTEYAWPWYNKLVGAWFDGHPQPQQALYHTIDRNFPATRALPDTFRVMDEIYNFRSVQDSLHYLITADESSYEGGKMGAFHPIAWYHHFEGGRQFYLGLGHFDEEYAMPFFVNTVWEGLQWTMGMKDTMRVKDTLPPNNYTTASWWAPAPPPFSPVVHEDRSITFRIRAPRAGRIDLLFGEWDVKPRPMVKDSAGVWSISIPPVAPGIYSYVFQVDGLIMPDMNNPVTKAGTQLYSSMVEVSGGAVPRPDELQGSPHGATEILHYTSTPLHRLRSLYVYLPPRYFTGQRLPVLYLRHGGGDDESSWTQAPGKADIILDNLLAHHKAVPMIIVMTNGLTDGTWAGGSSPQGMKALEEELLVDVIPLIESRYRTQPGAAGRAIAGLSMGGGQSFVIGLRHLEKFSWIGDFSAGLLADKNFRLDTTLAGVRVDSSLNRKIRLLWLGCGTDDPRYIGYLHLLEELKRRGIRNEFHGTPGGHEWKVWRSQLEGFLQKIFQTSITSPDGK